MTTAEYEKELRKLQRAGHITEAQLQEALRMHRLYKAGKTFPKMLKGKLEKP